MTRDTKNTKTLKNIEILTFLFQRELSYVGN